MKQNLVINAFNSTNDMGIRNCHCHRMEVPVDELEVGKTISLSEYRNLKVLSLTDEELTFVINKSVTAFLPDTYFCCYEVLASLRIVLLSLFLVNQ